MTTEERIMKCGHSWIPKRGLKTRGMCLDCYSSYLSRLNEGRDERMERVRRNVGFCNLTIGNEETQLLAFFDAVMPEIPIWRASKLAKQILESK